MFRVGTAGWCYQDWEGIVYPRGASRSKRALTILAQLFDVLEINVTFYRPPSAHMANDWAERVASRPSFLFTAKLWQGFTHQRDDSHADEEKRFRDGIAPLLNSGRLGALLAQFPHSFRNTSANYAYLESLLGRFGDLPLVIELRHASWMQDRLLRMLDARGVGFCNVDQPIGASGIRPSAIMTGGCGYVRLHGRNSKEWFRKGAGRDKRYDYLYGPEEIHEWADRLRLMQTKSFGRNIFLIANNHYRGQAPANALELMARVTGKPVPVPDSLLGTFPHLAPIATRFGVPGESGRLPL